MTGRVHALSGKTVFVEGTEAACCGCLNQECRSCKQIYPAENSESLQLVPGQIVETGVSRRVLLSQGFTGIVLPVLSFAAGFGTVNMATGRENLSILGGFLGLLFTGLWVYLFRRRFPPKGTVRILRALETGTPNSRLSHSADRVILYKNDIPRSF
ncbi:MAG: SoxR reducing system RseC family protein [Treponema sp.]|jgi:positive regulator of sigma E activity|nr:SoxR reducing system RseC family protein [Treponema sp.]